MRISACVEHGEEKNKDLSEKEQGKERAKRQRVAENKTWSCSSQEERGAVAVTALCSKTELTDPGMERRGWGWVRLISKGEGGRKTRSIFSCCYGKRKWAIVFVALMQLASRQTGTDGLTHFSVRRSYGVRKARLGTKALEDLIWLWLLLLEHITALCSSCMRHRGQTWHWGSGVKPACACSLPSSQLAEYLLWAPAGGRQGPAEGNIWPIAVTKCPHHPR